MDKQERPTVTGIRYETTVQRVSDPAAPFKVDGIEIYTAEERAAMAQVDKVLRQRIQDEINRAFFGHTAGKHKLPGPERGA